MHYIRFFKTAPAFIFSVFIFVSASAAMAQSSPPLGPMGMPTMKPVALTEGMVKNILKSLPAMRAFSKKHKLDESVRSMKGDPNADFLKYLDAKNLRAPMQSMLASYGFESIEQWTGAMQSMVMAYGFVRTGKTLAQVRSEMQTMIDKLEADPNLPANQKKSLAGMFKKQMNMVMNMTPEGNIKAVSGLMPQIDQAMKAAK